MAKAIWYTLGDKNIKYFHACATQRRTRDKITQEQDDHGNSLQQREEI